MIITMASIIYKIFNRAFLSGYEKVIIQQFLLLYLKHKDRGCDLQVMLPSLTTFLHRVCLEKDELSL